MQVHRPGNMTFRTAAFFPRKACRVSRIDDLFGARTIVCEHLILAANGASYGGGGEFCLFVSCPARLDRPFFLFPSREPAIQNCDIPETIEAKDKPRASCTFYLAVVVKHDAARRGDPQLPQASGKLIRRRDCLGNL